MRIKFVISVATLLVTSVLVSCAVDTDVSDEESGQDHTAESLAAAVSCSDTAPCPGFGTCVEGACVCEADATACAQFPPNHFVKSPKVCACIPNDPNICSSVFCPSGLHCEITASGMPTCVCDTPLCGVTPP